MRRFALGLAAGLCLAWAGLALSQGTPAPGAFRIQGADGGMARISHYGGLMVTIVGGDWGLETQDVNVRHVNTVVHIASAALAPANQALSVRCVNTAGTAFEACGGGSSSGDAVNVFHQSTVAHVSSVTHVSGRVILTNVAGAPVTLTGSALDVNCTGCAAASVVAISHISAAVHLAGGVTDQNNRALRVTGVTVFSVMGAIDHIASQVHVANTGILNSLAVRCVNTGATAFEACGGAGTAADAVNVFHQSTIAHISSVTHVVLASAPQDHVSGAFRAWRVANCGTTARTVVNTNPSRRDLYLQNLGGAQASVTHNNLYLGYGAQGHVALTINNGWVLHSMGFLGAGTTPATGPTSSLILYNYQGPLACVSATATGVGPQLSILEILR